jgi:hypothetical protein
LDLDDDWNRELLPHQGRHPNDYHDYILTQMKDIDAFAQGDKEIFLDLYETVKAEVRGNPEMMYKAYWLNK